VLIAIRTWRLVFFPEAIERDQLEMKPVE
jgi:hypothetical protein